MLALFWIFEPAEPPPPHHFPNVHAVAAEIAEENPAQNVAALEQQAKACVRMCPTSHRLVSEKVQCQRSRLRGLCDLSASSG